MKRYNKILSILLILSMIISPVSGIFNNVVNAESLITEEVDEESAELKDEEVLENEELDEEVKEPEEVEEVEELEEPEEVEEVEETLTPKEQLNKNLQFIYEGLDNPSFGTGGGEWSILSLARGEYPVHEGYYDIYYNNVVEKVKELMPKYSGKLHRVKLTEHSRLILGFGSVGFDITDVAGYDIRDALADYNTVIKQGINGPIFALIALDTNNYEIPIVEGVATQTTRNMLIEYILDKEINGAGWALGGNNPDPDITAMAIQGLTPYYDREDVKPAVDRAINWLSENQKEDGGYASWGSINSESVSQVIVALTGLEIDPHTDSRFVKNGYSAIDNLMTFAVKDGGFMHVKPGGNTGGGGAAGKVDGMATDQGTYALVAYDRFIKGKTSLYDMTDLYEEPVTIESINRVEDIEVEYNTIEKYVLEKLVGTTTIVDSEGKEHKVDLKWTIDNYNAKEAGEYIATGSFELPEGLKQSEPAMDLKVSAIVKVNEDKLIIDVPKDSEDDKDYQISIESGYKNQEINIPEEKESKVIVNLPSNTLLPKIEAKKGNISVEIPKGTQITSQEDSSSLEMITSKDKLDEDINTKVKHIISKGNKDKQLEKIEEVFTMGGEDKVIFSDYITLTFKGMSGKDAAYIQGENINLIKKYDDNTLGKASSYDEYAYDYEDDLIIKTKHFTDFLAYTTKDKDESDVEEPEGPKDPVTPEEPKPDKPEESEDGKSYITLSIDKKTIDKGYTLKPTKVEITEDESVWDVLKREMDSRGIGYDYDDNSQYGSVYIESIDGDGEFDHGSGSGWMYNVDGWYPNYGASVYNLKDGQVVQWRYTTDLGADLGEDITQWDQPDVEINGVKDNEIFKEREIKFEVTAKATYGPIKGKDADVTVKLNGKTLSKSAGKYTATLSDGKNTLEIVAIDSEGNRRDVKYTLVCKVNGETDSDKDKDDESKDKVENGKDKDDSVEENKEEILTKEEEEIKTELGKIYKDSNSISSWALEPIKRATELGFIQGSGNGFNAKSNITRAEFTKVMTSVLDINIEATGENSFSDINEDDWYYSYINAAYKAGIIQGNGEEFNPNDNITREQMAAIIVRGLKLEHVTSDIEIKDMDKVSNWAKKDVETVVSLGLVKGYSGKFDPKFNATREMATVIAMRGYDYKNSDIIED